MNKIKNLKGRVFGLLKVVEQAGRRRGGVLWRCLCACGAEKTVREGALMSRTRPTRSCGCLRRFPWHRQDLVGQRFGRLTVLWLAGMANGNCLWHCRCDCGKEKDVRAGGLKRGASSCGCLATTHGLSKSGTYNAWHAAKQRCGNRKNPNFHHYGGRGIEMCKRWRDSFEAFLADMGERPVGTSLERRNNERGYNKANCNWATRRAQSQNTRRNKCYTHEGRTLCIADWAEDANLPYATLRSRLITLGWTIGDALAPVQARACAKRIRKTCAVKGSRRARAASARRATASNSGARATRTIRSRDTARMSSSRARGRLRRGS